MFVMWHWLERGQSGLLIQLQFTACVLFSVYYFCLLLNTEETTFQTKKMNLSLSVDAKINLNLWTSKPDHCVESFRIRSFFLVPIFSRIWTEYGDLQSKSLSMWHNMDQTNPECEHFSRSWRQNIASLF